MLFGLKLFLSRLAEYFTVADGFQSVICEFLAFLLVEIVVGIGEELRLSGNVIRIDALNELLGVVVNTFHIILWVRENLVV